MGVKNKKSGGQAAKGGVISLQEHPLFIYEEDLIMNHVALTGKISQDIELHTTGNDNSVTTIHVWQFYVHWAVWHLERLLLLRTARQPHQMSNATHRIS